MWTLFALCFATSLATWPISYLRTGSLDLIRENLFQGVLVSGGGLVLRIVSLLTAAPWWHRIAVAGSLIFFLVHYGPMQIG